jgi:MFS transporter, FSR family, fosmidomycin resistance protein
MLFRKNDLKPLPSPDGPMQPGRITLISSAHFINDIYPGFLAPLLPLLMDKIGFGITLAALLASIMAIFNSMAQPVFGLMADKMKRPHMVIWGPLLTTVFFGSIGLVNSYSAIVIILIMSGIGTAAFHPQSAAITGHASGNRKGLGMSIFVTGGAAGHSLGPVIIMAIVTFIGLEYSYLTMSYGFVMVFFLFRYMPELPHAPMQKSHITVRNQSPRKMLSLFFLWLTVTVRAFIITGFITFIPILLHDKNYSLLLAGAAITLYELAGAAGSLFGGFLSDKYGRKIVIFVSFAASLPFLWLFLHSSQIVSFVFLAIAGAIMFSSIPVTIIMAQELYPQRVNTVSSLVMGLSWGIGGLLVTPLGAIAERIGLENALHILIGLGVVALLSTLLLPETKNRRVLKQ